MILQEAKDYCAANGAHLFLPKTKEDMIAVALYLKEKTGLTGYFVWTGLRKNLGN